MTELELSATFRECELCRIRWEQLSKTEKAELADDVDIRYEHYAYFGDSLGFYYARLAVDEEPLRKSVFLLMCDDSFQETRSMTFLRQHMDPAGDRPKAAGDIVAQQSSNNSPSAFVLALK